MEGNQNSNQNPADAAADPNVQPVEPVEDGGSASGQPAEGDGQPVGDGSGTGDQSGDQAAKKAGEGDDAGEVDADSYDLKLAEDSSLADQDVKWTRGVAKELGLSQEQAQKLLDAQNAHVQQAMTQQREAWSEQTKQWGEQIKQDKTLGGDNYQTTVQHCRLAIDKFASPDLKKALNETGFGNHPDLVRCFAKIGKAMSEDRLVTAGESASDEADAASILYPNDTK